LRRFRGSFQGKSDSICQELHCDQGCSQPSQGCRGGVIAEVRAGSIGAGLGLRPGDKLVSINGHPLRDVIDYRFYGSEEELELVAERGEERIVYEVERGYDQELGVEFVEPTFDGLRRCNNRCEFCFLKGMPPGMRHPLYIRDDDYRYSFLFGNFITLTNLAECDWHRLAEQRLSPLYVSVHATDLALRRRILGNPAAPDVVEQLKRLGSLGIQVHAQIVLIPGLNDGCHLAHTVANLTALYPTVQSIAVVPLGLTKYHRGPFRIYRPEEAGPILTQISVWQREYRRQRGLNLVYASDEWYLLAGWKVPVAEEYDGFPQLENGVGLTRMFLDEEWRVSGFEPFDYVLRQAQGGPQGKFRVGKITLVCGTLIAPLLEKKAAELSDMVIEVVPVENRFFGPTVTVSGLLTGRDVVGALQGRDFGDLVFLPRAMFDAAGEHTLDDMSPAEIGERLGARVEMGACLFGRNGVLFRPRHGR
jgi:putative radical SAM enzyme (TIGR03279 family)